MTPSVETTQLRIGFQKPLDQSPLEIPDGWCDGSVQEFERVYNRMWRTWKQNTRKDKIEYEVRYDLENHPQKNCTVYLNEYLYNEKIGGYQLLDVKKEREAEMHSDYTMAEVAIDLMKEVNEEFRSDTTNPDPENTNSSQPELTEREECLMKRGYQRPIDRSPFKTPNEWKGGSVESAGGGNLQRAWWNWDQDNEGNKQEYRVVYGLHDRKVTLVKREYGNESNVPTGNTTLKTVEADWESDYSMAEAAIELIKYANKNMLDNTEAYYYESRTVDGQTEDEGWGSTISSSPPPEHEDLEVQNVQELVTARSVLDEATRLNPPTVGYKYKVGTGDDETIHFGSEQIINNRTDRIHSTVELIPKPEPRRVDDPTVIYFKHKNKTEVYYRVHQTKNTAEVYERNGGIADVTMWKVWNQDRDGNLKEVDYEETPFSDLVSKSHL